jgi:hypothetical protein
MHYRKDTNKTAEQPARRYMAALALLVPWLAFLLPARADCPPCGPLYCKDTSQYSAVLASKKRSLAASGYPGRMIAILDRVGHCEGCISTGPDGFSLFTATPDGKIRIDGWDADNERIGANQKKSGTLKSCFVIYVRHACPCCKDAKFDQRSDYDATLDLNTDMAIPCAG